MRGAAKLLEGSIKTRGTRGPNSRGEYSLICPFCKVKTGTPDNKWKLNYNPTKHLFYCYRCESHGAVTIPSLEPNAIALAVAEEPEVKKDVWLGPPKGFTPLTEPGLSMLPFTKYMEKRGLLKQAIAVGAGAVGAGRFGMRVVFPMKSATGPWRGFSARSIVKGVEPPYLYPTGMDKKNEVYGLDFIDRKEIWLTEGVMDAIALWPHGVASFGKNVSDEQLKKLASCNRPVTVCLDGDAWELGFVVADRLLHDFGARNVSVCKLPLKTDPGVLQWDVRKYAHQL